MNLYPKELRDEQNIESKFYLPQKHLLIEEKDKDPEQQDSYIQASTRRLKPIFLNGFLMKFHKIVSRRFY